MVTDLRRAKGQQVAKPAFTIWRCSATVTTGTCTTASGPSPWAQTTSPTSPPDPNTPTTRADGTSTTTSTDDNPRPPDPLRRPTPNHPQAHTGRPNIVAAVCGRRSMPPRRVQPPACPAPRVPSATRAQRHAVTRYSLPHATPGPSVCPAPAPWRQRVRARDPAAHQRPGPGSSPAARGGRRACPRATLAADPPGNSPSAGARAAKPPMPPDPRL